MGELSGYARVSTTDQSVDPQSEALSTADCFKVWTETGRLDRLGRSLPRLLQTVEGLAARGVGFKSLTEAIDTTTSGGKLIFSIFGTLAEFERNLIRERTRVGLAAARARGRTGCRPPKMTATKLVQAQRMRSKGRNLTGIAEIICVGRTTLYRHLKYS